MFVLSVAEAPNAKSVARLVTVGSVLSMVGVVTVVSVVNGLRALCMVSVESVVCVLIMVGAVTVVSVANGLRDRQSTRLLCSHYQRARLAMLACKKKNRSSNHYSRLRIPSYVLHKK